MNVLDQYKLDGKLAVVTGGAGLLGIKHCEGLLEAGSSVIAIDIDGASLTSNLKILKNKYNENLVTYKCDISNEIEIINLKKKIYEEFNRFPCILINNAAIDSKQECAEKINPSRLENFNVDQWNSEISVGLTGSMLCVKHFGVEMAHQKKGVILNISSDLGIIAPNQTLYASKKTNDDSQNVKPVTYSVIKHGVIGLTRYISTYWAKNGVRCNALAPGGVHNGHSDEFTSKINNLIPLGRMADIDEYKATVVYMCSDASSYMNGAIISIDGGRTAW